MSQMRRRPADDSSFSQQRKLSASPPTRSPLSSSPSHPSLAGNLIPRDYLGLRTAAAAPTTPTPATPATAIDSRKPSPLHTSFGPHSLRRENPESSQSPLSPRSTAGSRSPLHAQLSGGRRPHPGLSPSSASSNEASRERSDSFPRHIIADGRPDHAQDMADGAHLLQDRTTAGTPDSLPSSTVSPISPDNNSQLPKLRDRPGQRVMPRTSSIDSAISALSSVSHAHKSSFDANTLSPSDISQLISAAGSPEAVIVHLLKEKHHAASQNAQLWRLVDKQRALILGLNKDMERALKEKEKYKKKVKELQSTVTPMPLSVSGSSLAQPSEDLENRTAPTPSSPSSDGTHKTPSNHDTQWTVTGPPRDALPFDGPNKAASAVKTDMPPLNSSILPTMQPQEGRRQDGFNSRPDTASSDEDGADFLPIQGATEKIPQPSRRPPPAPLNLVQPERVPADDSLSDGSESEYEDLLGVGDPSLADRGRRKTREDDDRERESQSASKTKPKPAISSRPPAAAGSGAATETAMTATGSSGVHSHIPAALQPGAAATDDRHLPSGTAEGQFLSSPADRMITLPPKSPGLPLSPRPGDRPLGSPMPRDPRDMSHPVASPPTSPSGPLPGLPLSPRANKFPSTSTQPEGPSHGPSKTNGTVPSPISVDLANRPIPSIDAAIQIDSPHLSESSIVQVQSRIYQGLMSDDYPNLLLPPNALPLIHVRVYASRLRPSRNSYLGPKPADEEPVFTLSVFSRSENRELWRVEKVIAALPQLDHQLRQHCNFPVKVPDRSIFSGHSPAKIDARRAMLNAYFEALLDTPMDERAAITVCQFLSLDAIQARDDETTLLDSNGPSKPEILRGPDGKPRKEGYLAKRGKNFGGWKARYFVLHGPELKYFESPGGAHLGTIKLPHAQIGKQSQSAAARSMSPTRTTDEDPENQYRHAFLILEPKKKDSSALVRHVLCAESDEERDAWVDVLMEYVDGGGSDYDTSSTATQAKMTQSHAAAKQAAPGGSKGRLFQRDNRKGAGKAVDGYEYESLDSVQGFSYDDAVPAEPPIVGTSLDTAPHRPSQKPPPAMAAAVESVNAGLYSSSPTDQRQLSSYPSVLISAPTNGAVIQDAGAWGNKAATSTKEKKRSIWGFRRGSSIDLASQLQAHEQGIAHAASSNNLSDRRDPVRPVFGMPLAEAVVFCGPTGIESELPAVVYRCIEYLRAKDAQLEEGIFRLSGSNVVIKALKERFNTEGDIDFLADDQYYDVHAVASLFKQYLRELPTTVLTRELHLDFLRVLELDEKQKKIIAFNTLVHKLPKPNLALLKALAEFLLGIVNNSDVNKMTVRNVGIVFAPTLNIPAPVFATFLTEFDSIFDNPADPTSAQAVELGVPPSLTPEDIRSPRRQMFSDNSTPGYNQTSFQGPENGADAGHRNVTNAKPDTGFVPVQYTYETTPYKTEPNEYNHNNPTNGNKSSTSRMLGSGMENGQSIKAKRRESSLLFMDPNNRRHSTILSFADTKMTEEEESGYEREGVMTRSDRSDF